VKTNNGILRVETTNLWGIIVCSVILGLISYPRTDGLVRQQMRKEVKMVRKKKEGIEKE
jgi:uncharacterized protein (DUF2062 family)